MINMASIAWLNFPEFKNKKVCVNTLSLNIPSDLLNMNIYLQTELR